MKLKLKENQLIFDMDNPNCKINMPIEKISLMLKNIPVRLEEGVIIGVVTDITNIIDSKIFGTIIIFDDSKDYTDMKNYEMIVNTISSNPFIVDVKSIQSITVELEEEHGDVCE
jgi:hypothetical protein